MQIKIIAVISGFHVLNFMKWKTWFFITGLIFTPEIFIVMQKSMEPRGPGTMNLI